MTFSDHVKRVAQNIQNLATDTYTTTVIPLFVNEAYRDIWDADLWEDTLADPFVFAISPNSDTFTLDKRYSAIVRAFNDDDGQEIKLRDMVTFSAEYWTQARSRSLTSGFDSLAALTALGVLNQLGTAQQVKVVSANVLDAGNVFVRGRDVNHETISEVIALSGTTPVVSVFSYSAIEAFGKLTTPTRGVITLTDNTGTALATLGMWEKTARYRRYQFNGKQADFTNLRLICKRAFVPFQNYYDYPFMDVDNCLPHKATALAWMENRQTDMAALEAKAYQEGLGKLRDREFSEENSQWMVPQMRG